MKIAQIILSNVFGGVERYAIDLTRALAERGHEVVTIARSGSDCEALFADIPTVRPHSLPISSLLGKRDVFASRRVQRILADFKPEVVQAHQTAAAYISGRATKALGLPLLVHAPNDFLKLKYYRYVDVFIPPTKTIYRYLRAHHIPAEKISLLPNFSTFAAVDAPKIRAVKRIISLGRFHPEKGFDLLIQAIARLGDSHIELILAGDGAERERISALIAEYTLQDRVQLVGWQWENAIRELLLQSDLFVLSSRYESFGIALLEAMASGIPVVTTNCDGPREILDETSAWFCEVGSVASLAAAMEQAIADHAGRQAKAEKALALYQDNYTIDKAVSKFEALYEKQAASVRP